MFANRTQIINGIKRFIEIEIIPKADPLKQFVIYFLMPNMDQIIGGYMNSLMEEGTVLSGLVDENCNVNIDAALSRAVEALSHMNGKLHLKKFGVILNTDDMNKIYELISKS